MLLASLLALAAPQTTWHVDISGTAPGTGTVLDPYTSVAYALAQPGTASGDTISVQPGTYANEAIDFAGKDVTVRSTTGAGSTVLVAPPFVAGPNAQFFPVARFDSGETRAARLEGFTLRAGTGHFDPAFDPSGPLIGGDIYINGSSPTISRCLIADSSFASWGGGAAVLGGSPRFEHCAFQDLDAGTRGAAIFAQDSSVDLFSCTIEECGSMTGAIGGGVAAIDSVLTLQFCFFNNNAANFRAGHLDLENCQALVAECDMRLGNVFGRAGAIDQTGGVLVIRDTFIASSYAGSDNGGAIHVSGPATTAILDSRFFLNTAFDERLGGALYFDGERLDVFNTEFESNDAGHGAGALASSGTVRFVGCTFKANRAWDCPYSFACSGAGLEARGTADVTAERCVFLENTAEAFQGSGAGTTGVRADHCTYHENIAATGGNVVDGGSITNSIVYGNFSPALSASTTASYSLVEGGAPGAGNIIGDPSFWGFLDVHLLPGSLAIDAASPIAPLDANSTRSDMGAFPFDPDYCGEVCSFGSIGYASCASLPNSSGLPAVTEAIGSPSISNDRVLLNTDGLPPGAVGAFLASQTQDFVPFFGGSEGILCLGGSILRFTNTPVTADPFGRTSFRPELADFPQGTTVLSGDRWTFQLWFRDSGPVGATSNTASAVEVTLF